jgi:hypothetical protein
VLLLPAIVYNVDWTGHGSWQANATAVIMILASALFIEAGHIARDWVLTPLLMVAALCLVVGNTKQAMRNLSLSNEVASEVRAATLAGGSHLASQRSHLLARRNAQVEIAGETTVGTLKAQLEALQLSDPRTWNATDGCEEVRAKASGAFCARVAAARGKIEAAAERDRLDAELAKLPLPTVVAPTSTEAPVVDPYVANTKALLEEVGFKPTERLIKAEEALFRAFLLELTAAFGPTAWLLLVSMLQTGVAHVSAAAARMRKPAAKALPASEAKAHTPALPENADDLDRCIADVFEDAPAGKMAAKEIRPLVVAWHEVRNLKLDESKLWMRMGQRFRRDPNNGRPRYLGLRPRVKGSPRLAVVGGQKA